MQTFTKTFNSLKRYYFGENNRGVFFNFMWLALICSSITRLTRNHVNPELLYEGGSLFCTKAEPPNVVFIYRLLCLHLQHYILNLIITKDNFPKKGDVISLLFYNGGSSSWLIQVIQVKQLAVSIFLSCYWTKIEIVIILLLIPWHFGESVSVTLNSVD